MHAHGGRAHSHVPPAGQDLGWRILATMGIAGGLVPSPSALVVLLGAAALGRPVFGAVLVVGYGIGIALTLTVAGLLLLRAQARLDQTGWTSGRAARAVRALPALTAAVVLSVGALVVLRGLLTLLRADLSQAVDRRTKQAPQEQMDARARLMPQCRNQADPSSNKLAAVALARIPTRRAALGCTTAPLATWVLQCSHLTARPAAKAALRLRPSLAGTAAQDVAPGDAGLVLGELLTSGGRRGPRLHSSWEDVLLAFMAPR